jgi:hypothetical protein
LINGTQADSALRIGVYGSWGEGKTSVLRLVDSLCLKANIPVCWFSVWSAQTQPALWAGLFNALQSLPEKRDRLGTIKAAAGKFLSATAPLADLDKYAKAAHALAKLANLEVGAKEAKRVIDNLGTNTRVVVLVDDVDRVDSQLIPKLLMGLHDLFEELGRCAFVIALDPTVVSGGLSQMNPAWSSAPEFLEKIVQYPFRLPRPTQQQMQRLVLEALKESRLNVPQQAVLDVLDLLPPNPRKVKQFIRSLQRLQPTLSRLGEDEWNPTLLLLLDLLRTTSAETAGELLQDEKFVQEFVLGRVFTRAEDMHEGDKITKNQYERIKAAVATTMPLAPEDDRTRLIKQITEIASAATDRLALVTPDDAMRHARLDHEPPVITLSEFDTLIQAWQKTSSIKILDDLLATHAKSRERSETEVLEACTLALLKRRGQLIDTAADTFDALEAQGLIKRVEMHSSLLDQLIAERKVLQDTRITSRVEMFLTMRTQTAQFTNRLDHEPYTPVRESLREQLYRASAELRDRAADILSELKPWDKSVVSHAAGADVLKETRERLFTIFSTFLCESTLERFRRPGGIAAIGDFLSNPAECWLLFTAGTVFHQPECRGRLLSIAQDKDEVVAQNFFVYLSMIVGGRAFAESPLARDASLIAPAWQAAFRVRPQPAMQGQVTELVKRLRAALNNDESIQMPNWVKSNDKEVVESSGGAGTPTISEDDL